MKELSIFQPTAAAQVEALQKSRLSALIEDKGLFTRIIEASVALLSNEKIKECDESSILGALYKAASLGCRLEPEFGEAFLIPRKIKGSMVCCFQLGYKYWKAQALESGHISFLEAREVYQEDTFSFEYGSNAFIKHIPADETSGQTTHFYARARLKDGSELFEVINKQGAEKSRASSETQYDWPGGGKEKVFSEKPKDIWAKHYAAMALRRPIKRICAALPLTSAIEAAQQADGSVTYLQKDGQLVTMSPIEVEKVADGVEENSINPELADKYMKTTDALAAMQDMKSISEYWAGFKTTELAKKAAFSKLFAVAFCNAAKSNEDLAAAWAEMGPYSTVNKDVFTARRKEISDGK